MKKLLMLFVLSLICTITIGQIGYYSTNRLDYGKLIRVGFTYELVYPDFYAWDLYILSGLDIDFWEWYDQYYAWRFRPYVHFTYNTYYCLPYDYWYMKYNYGWWNYSHFYYYNYSYYWYYGKPSIRPTNYTYGKRPDNKPIVIDNITRPKPTRINKQHRDSRPVREDNIRPENIRTRKPEPRPERQVNPTYKQPERETRPRFNDTKPKENNNTSRPNRVEQSRPINNQQGNRSGGSNRSNTNTTSERKR